MAGTTYPAVRTELPGPRSRQLLERLDRVLISSLTDHDEVPFVEARKSDWVIDDVDGNTFADHVSAWGTTQLGATPRSVLRAVTEAQARYGMEITDYIPNEPELELAELLVRIAPPGLSRVAVGVSGTLVVEGGVKLARAIAMILGQASGQTGVSGLDRLDQRTMLQGGLIQRREHPLVQPQERPEHRHVPHEHLVDPRVAR